MFKQKGNIFLRVVFYHLFGNRYCKQCESNLCIKNNQVMHSAQDALFKTLEVNMQISALNNLTTTMCVHYSAIILKVS